MRLHKESNYYLIYESQVGEDSCYFFRGSQVICLQTFHV